MNQLALAVNQLTVSGPETTVTDLSYREQVALKQMSTWLFEVPVLLVANDPQTDDDPVDWIGQPIVVPSYSAA